MKINLKKGLRRILLTVLALVSCYYIFLYIINGCIFWKIDYISEAKVIEMSNNQNVQSLIDFSEKNFAKKRELSDYTSYYFETLGFKIHPYKRYFENYDNHVFKDNEIYKINNKNYQIKLPSSLKYLCTQFWQFMLIPLINLIILLLYLLIETILSWIIKGFKEESKS